MENKPTRPHTPTLNMNTLIQDIFNGAGWKPVKFGDCKFSQLIMLANDSNDEIPFGQCRMSQEIYASRSENSDLEKVKFGECPASWIIRAKQPNKEVWSEKKKCELRPTDIVFYRQAASGLWTAEQVRHCRNSSSVLTRKDDAHWIPTEWGLCKDVDIVMCCETEAGV